MATLSGGLGIEYTANSGLFLTYCESRQELQNIVNAVRGTCKQWGMAIRDLDALSAGHSTGMG